MYDRNSCVFQSCNKLCKCALKALLPFLLCNRLDNQSWLQAMYIRIDSISSLAHSEFVSDLLSQAALEDALKPLVTILAEIENLIKRGDEQIPDFGTLNHHFAREAARLQENQGRSNEQNNAPTIDINMGGEHNPLRIFSHVRPKNPRQKFSKSRPCSQAMNLNCSWIAVLLWSFSTRHASKTYLLTLLRACKIWWHVSFWSWRKMVLLKSDSQCSSFMIVFNSYHYLGDNNWKLQFSSVQFNTLILWKQTESLIWHEYADLN